MQQFFHDIILNTNGRGFYNFTNETLKWIDKQKISNGILNVNILHTSASLIIQENADPDVLEDLENFFDKLVPMNKKLYKHIAEGKDDMPAHIKTALTNTNLSLSFQKGRLILGTWQAIYLWEHRFSTKERSISVHILGEKS